MSLTLDEFYQIMNLIGSYMAAGFNALNSAYIIDDGAFKLSLFELALGFVVLEFALSIINRLRGQEADFASASQSTGKQPKSLNKGSSGGSSEINQYRLSRRL